MRKIIAILSSIVCLSAFIDYLRLLSENESVCLVIYIGVVIAASVFNLVIYKKIWN